MRLLNTRDISADDGVLEEWAHTWHFMNIIRRCLLHQGERGRWRVYYYKSSCWRPR